MAFSLKTEWDYSELLTDFSKEQEEVEAHCRAFIDTYRKDKSYLTDPKALGNALGKYSELVLHYMYGGKQAFYLHLKSSIDQEDAQIKASQNKLDDFWLKISNDMTFFELDLGHIAKETQEIFLKDINLQKYHHFLERIFEEAKYTLSEKEENILSLMGRSAFSDWVEMVEKFLSKEERMILTEDGKKEKKSFATIMSLTNDQNKAVRDDAAAKLNEILAKHVDSAAEEMNAILYTKKVQDELRGFKAPEDGRMLADNMDKATVEALVSEVTNNFDIAKDYYALKAKLFGFPKLLYHERNLEYGSVDMSYTFDEAFALAIDAIGSLDSEFYDIMLKFGEEGRYDVYPKKGKADGAFCTSLLKSQPTYILLNFTNKLRDVTTLAHETGHGINSELTRKAQGPLYFGNYLSTAEVASTFMEDFVLEKLLKDADDEMKLSIYMNKLNDEVSTIIRQIAFFNFEKDLHALFREKGYITKQEIGQLFQKHMVSYMGESVEQSKGSENWWTYVGHFRSFFYVYTYASGLLISKAMQHAVRKDSGYITLVKEFLSTGTSLSPYDTFKKMGIDIADHTFWKSGISELRTMLQETTMLAKKLGKI